MPAVAGYAAGTFFNPATVAGSVPADAGEVGPDYERRFSAPPPMPGESSALTDMRARTEEDWRRLQAAPPAQRLLPGQRLMGNERAVSAPPVAEAVIGGGRQVPLRPDGYGGQGSMVDQLLAGGASSGERGASGAPPAGPAPSAWGGTMRPLAIPKGTSLLEMKQMYGEYENDPVLAARRVEYDRNLAEYLRNPPAWQNREEFESSLASIPGAGQEILGHIQARAFENMPLAMRQEWEQKEMVRAATTKELTKAAANEASYQNFLKTATPDQVVQFHENYERTPDGWKPVRMMPWEKEIAAEAAFKKRATPDQLKQAQDDFELSPSGKWVKKASNMNPMEALSVILANNKAGGNGQGINPFRRSAAAPVSVPPVETPAAAAPGATSQTPLNFATEQEATSAGLPVGTIVLINGRRAVIE